MGRPKKEMGENFDNFTIDDSVAPVTKTEVPKKVSTKVEEKVDKPMINCLRNERIIVRHIKKETGMVTNPKHVLYGGMADNATRTFVVPRLSSGMFVNVLTDAEKAFLEETMGLEYNALSIYKRPETENFWSDANPSGIASVTLGKQDNYLNLADPEDYIRYKILLANKDYIAPSLKAMNDYPKATYQFVIIENHEEERRAKDKMSNVMKCYKEYGKVEDNPDILRVIIETLEGKLLADNCKLDFLQLRCNTLIQKDANLFLKVITDPILDTKVLIRKSVENGKIVKRGNYYYLREGNQPLCENNEEPVLSVAAKYLNAPKHQELLFALEAAQ